MWVNQFGIIGYLTIGMFFKNCDGVETEEIAQQNQCAKNIRMIKLRLFAIKKQEIKIALLVARIEAIYTVQVTWALITIIYLYSIHYPQTTLLGNPWVA